MGNVTPKTRKCDDCDLLMSRSRTCCPHCGRPAYFPNVDAATDSCEQSKLDKRYAKALAACDANGTQAVAAEFEAACAVSEAITAASVRKLFRSIGSGTDIFESYHKLEKLTNRVTGSSRLDWGKLRPHAEIEILGSVENFWQIFYACLSIDGHYLTNYGNCVGTLAETKIAHRASCFEGNTAVEYHRRHSFAKLARSCWQNRSKLCMAMFASDLTTTTTTAEFPTILLRDRGGIDDIFVEVHIFGPLTAHSFESVRFDHGKLSPIEKIYAQELSDRLKAANVKVL